MGAAEKLLFETNDVHIGRNERGYLDVLQYGRNPTGSRDKQLRSWPSEVLSERHQSAALGEEMCSTASQGGESRSCLVREVYHRPLRRGQVSTFFRGRAFRDS